MAGNGPPPKPAAMRQRRNRQTGQASLPSAEESSRNKVPPLPDRDEGPWHPMVREWWQSVWRSPMAAEYLDADMRGGLYLLADLHQIRWCCRDSATALKEVASEIRLQEVRFGLSPIDRRKLQWEVSRVEEAERKKPGRAPKRDAPTGDDPRAALKAI